MLRWGCHVLEPLIPSRWHIYPPVGGYRAWLMNLRFVSVSVQNVQLITLYKTLQLNKNALTG